jgi:prolyl-tRNA synthetase
MQNEKTAITPTRQQDYPEWYQQVIKAAELGENSAVRGCMVIKPWGYGIWENLQRDLDRRIKETGHENAYFPLFIPLSYLEKEASHVSGFAKECAVVTHHRLEEKNGKLIPTGELEEPLIVRPTSETIIGESFSKWVQSYRDLPLLINQWANVVRWEMRTRMFLRTAEFLWQEGHTVHATEECAMRETLLILQMYKDHVEQTLAIPVIIGEKPAHERFPGAVRTFCLEAMMQDRKALQAGTSHYLGQNFAHASNIKFLNQEGAQEYAHTTSWGVSTRLIGGVIMSHSDDDGLRVPPKLAPKQIIILPVIPKEDQASRVYEYCDKVAAELKKLKYNDYPVTVHVDKRDIRGGEKSWQWIKKGAPVRIEIGPRDIDQESVMMYRRDKAHKDKQSVKTAELSSMICGVLDEIQNNYFNQTKEHLNANLRTDITSLEEFIKFFTAKNQEKPEIHGGFVKAFWSEDPETLAKLEELKVTIRCAPMESVDDYPIKTSSGTCILSGKPATRQFIFGKSY